MGLSKLTIKSFKEPDYTGEAEEFKVLINPETMKADYNIKYSDCQALGTSATELKFKHIPSGSISFKLVFDGTGLIASAPASLKGKSVPQQIEAFKKATIAYEGSIHRPYYLILYWGKSLFKGVLESLSINYKLFKPDGTALRAEADVVFKNSELAKEAAAKAKTQSADLTHLRQKNSGDRLPGMCNKIYGGPNYFIQVAKHNKLNHFRKIKNGKELTFPPLVS